MKVVLMVRIVNKGPPKRRVRLEKTLTKYEPQKRHKQMGKGGGGRRHHRASTSHSFWARKYFKEKRASKIKHSLHTPSHVMVNPF